MKTIYSVTFTLATFVFTWLLLAIAILIHFFCNLTLSLLVPFSTQSFAFITTFLALLVVVLLAVRKFIGLKKQSTQLEAVA